MMNASEQAVHGQSFQVVPLERIEDLSSAVRDANLDAVQISRARLSGSLVFGEQNGIVCTSGKLEGKVSLRGPLSQNLITLGVGLQMAPGCWQWTTEVTTGAVAIFRPCDEHDSIYSPGSLYAVVSLSEEQLEEEAAKDEIVLNGQVLGGAGIHKEKIRADILQKLVVQFKLIHEHGVDKGNASGLLLRALIDHLGRPPIVHDRLVTANHHAKIVKRAREYIEANLSEPISLDEIANAAFTSRRTLFRAFADVLDETPQIYVRRLRLHRIRENLASDSEKTCTITIIANQWGISELGRFSGWYKEMFGEGPRETLKRRRMEAHSIH